MNDKNDHPHNETAPVTLIGHIRIRDPDTGEMIVQRRDAHTANEKPHDDR